MQVSENLLDSKCSKMLEQLLEHNLGNSHSSKMHKFNPEGIYV